MGSSPSRSDAGSRSRSSRRTQGMRCRRCSRPARAHRRDGAPARSRAGRARRRTSGRTARRSRRRPSGTAPGSPRRSRPRAGTGTRWPSRASIGSERLGGEHVVAAAVQHLGELAGAGAEVDDVGAAAAGEPGDRLDGVGRPGAVVGVGDGAERRRGAGGPVAHCGSKIPSPPCPPSPPSPPRPSSDRARPVTGPGGPPGVADRPGGRALGVRRDPRRHRRAAARPRAATQHPRADRRVAAARRPRSAALEGSDATLDQVRDGRGRRGGRRPRCGSAPSCSRWCRCSAARRSRRSPGCTR